MVRYLAVVACAIGCGRGGRVDVGNDPNQRPTAARVPPGEGCALAPLDEGRAAFFQVDVGAGGALRARIAQARTLLGDGAFALRALPWPGRVDAPAHSA